MYVSFITNNILLHLIMISKFPQILVFLLLILAGCSANEEELIIAAKAKIDSERYPEAISYIDQAINKNKTNASLFNLRGVAYFLNEDYAKAHQDFSVAIKLDSSFYKPYYNRGNVHLEQKQYEKALFDYNQAIDLKPNNADLYVNRAIVLYELKQFEEAQADNDFAIKLNPNNYLPYLNKGKTLIKLGDFEESEQLLESVIKLNNTLGEAYYWLGFININSGNQQVGCDYLTKAKNRDFKEAIEALEKFCKGAI